MVGKSFLCHFHVKLIEWSSQPKALAGFLRHLCTTRVWKLQRHFERSLVLTNVSIQVATKPLCSVSLLENELMHDVVSTGWEPC